MSTMLSGSLWDALQRALCGQEYKRYYSTIQRRRPYFTHSVEATRKTSAQNWQTRYESETGLYSSKHMQCNAGGINSKIHSTRSIPSKYPLLLSCNRTWYGTYTRTNRWFTLKLPSGAESTLIRINVELVSNPNILLRIVFRRYQVVLNTSAESRGLYTSFLCTLTANSNNAFL